MKQMIELKNVSFRYDKTVEEYQIDTVSFHVNKESGFRLLDIMVVGNLQLYAD